jgi:hypothetical protein
MMPSPASGSFEAAVRREVHPEAPARPRLPPTREGPEIVPDRTVPAVQSRPRLGCEDQGGIACSRKRLKDLPH